MLRKYLCWLLGHSFLCVFRTRTERDYPSQGSEYTEWLCQYCNERKSETWDT